MGFEYKSKCQWCEVEMPDSEINSEGLCDRCDRAVEAREGVRQKKYSPREEKFVFPPEFEKVGLIDSGRRCDEFTIFVHPEFDRLMVYPTYTDGVWSVEFDGRAPNILKTTSEVVFFLKSLKQFASNIERFFSEEKGGNLEEYQLALCLIINNLNAKELKTEILRYKKREK